MKADWEQRNPPPRSHNKRDELARKLFARMEAFLDQGLGDCLLRRPELALLAMDAMHIGDAISHELGCYVVMPNHIHAIVRPLAPSESDLEDILRSWKGRSARMIHLQSGNSGALWQRESYDRIIRDPEHLWRVIQYIGRNPSKAKLPSGSAHLWINPNWIELGWKFEGSETREV